MNETQTMMMLFLVFFIAMVFLTVFLTKKGRSSTRLYWFTGCSIASVFAVGYLYAPLVVIVSLGILYLVRKDGDNPISDIIKGLFDLFDSALSLGIFAFYILCSLGGLYWLWMAVDLGSFWMFVVGIFPLSIFVTAPVGAYSLIFGMPDWVYSLFG